MIETLSWVLLAGAVATALSWVTPRRHAADAVAAWTAAALAWASPWSAVWLISTSAATSLMMQRIGSRPGRGPFTLGWIAFLVALLVASRWWDGRSWVGPSYFTLRQIHVVLEWWMARREPPSVRNHLRYQLFLPVMWVGPIHRRGHFERAWARRRWDSSEFFSGAERMLLGAAQALALGHWLLPLVALIAAHGLATAPDFFARWVGSLLSWIALYLSFSGWTSMALGQAAMMGLTLEENFRQPFTATGLVDFWTRWHITLSLWCRDYVFHPVAAWTRSPLLGLFAAMFVMGAWHELSLRYAMWAAWQALGIAVSHAARRLPGATWRQRHARWLGPPFVLGWVTLADPVIHLILSRFAS